MVAITPPFQCPNAFPFNLVPAQQADWQKMAKIFAPTGVVADGSWPTPLQVSQHGGGDLSVDIAPGRIWIEGAFAEFGTVTNLAIGTPPSASFPRNDLVVARGRWGGTPKIELDWVTGAQSNPATTPALTQTLGASWEIALAEVQMGPGALLIGNANIFDRRPYSNTAQSPTRLPAQRAAPQLTIPLNQFASYQPSVPFWVLPLTTAGTDVTVTQLNAGASNLPAQGAWLLIEAVPTNSNVITLSQVGNMFLPGAFPMHAGDHLLLYTDGSVWYEVTRNQPFSAPVPANLVLAGPVSGAAASMTPRLLVNGDLPPGPGDPVLGQLDQPGIDNGRLSLNVVRAPNLAINGGYEVWQRGPGPFTGGGNFTCDRHQIQLVGTDQLIVRADPTQHDLGSINTARLDFTLGNGGGQTRHTQYLKTVADNQGAVLQRQITYQVRVRLFAAGANVCRAGISWDGSQANTIWSPFSAATTAWQTLMVTATTAGDPSYVEFGVWLQNGNTLWVDNEVLVTGSVAPYYSGRLYQEDLALCQRYYQVLGASNNGVLIIDGYAGGPITRYQTMTLVTAMGGVPVGPGGTTASIKQGTWILAGVAAGQPSVDFASPMAVRMTLLASGAGEMFAHNGNPGAQLVLIWTP